jgi:hypothetical protein
MAMTVLDVTPAVPLQGDLVAKVLEVTFDAAYAAGGYALSAASLGLTTVHRVSGTPVSGYVPEYDLSAHKLKVMYGDNNNASDGPLIQVADNTAGINALKSRLLVIGVL